MRKYLSIASKISVDHYGFEDSTMGDTTVERSIRRYV
jgi:hypothetical protein